MTVERFGGIVPTDFPYMGPLPGGGYRGLTDELDALAVEAASLLTAEYGRDVVIRFNANRRSGGAWLKDAPTRDTLVGLNAGLRIVRTPEMTDDDYLDLHRSPWHDRGTDRAGRPVATTIVFHTYVATPALVDPALAQNGYAYVAHPSLAAGIEWLRENARVGA